ncbi:hypothetical protein L227DRAFT_519663 [Lentinus tigrinus ALCF2SS1-6]|uniref:F-box domain-containing protein n=1 Tax=Lentinus tigrinus ALCF2SS1-6 TaxID=1328759 RepID=A0A5C2SPE4_9APHY|nr:hypothetical protein L227DRAFT_519663 [Lentinus tigrinus ALCF2SS1-6]
MGASLDNLPVELYFALISHFEPDDLQQSLVSLSLAIPRSPVPTSILFENIRLRRAEQILKLYLRVRNAPDDAALTHSLSLECWSVDADVFVNLIALFPNLVNISMYVGPNFAPEHLEEIFILPRPKMRFLSMRFRPYVQRATYYHFLKGAYFDSTLLALSRWPPQVLPTLAVVQDPLDPSLAPTHFAQPLVFHRLNPLADLAVSPICYNLRHFRLRVPSRPITRHLHARPNALPSVELLDLSTSNVSARDLEGLLGHLPSVQTLILDSCPIVTQRTDIQVAAGEPFLQWMELGQALALAGVKRAIEREKSLRTWMDNYYARRQQEEAQGGGSSKKPRRGRRGLATAAFSLRAPSPERKDDREVTILEERIPRNGQRVRVLPSPPTLCSVATSYPGGVTPEIHEAVKAEFERGWAAGIARLSSIRLRLKTSYQNGIARVVRFADIGTSEWEEERVHGQQGLAGLVDVNDVTAFALDVVGDDEAEGSAKSGHQCPLLCLAGPARDAVHVDGCGHRQGWDVFKDEI